MKEKMVKLYGKSGNKVALHVIPGHFATSHSHINFYIDITSLKTRVNEAEQVAKVIAADYAKNTTIVDTIVCMDGTEMIGAFLAKEFEKRGFFNRNQHDTIYVVTPEYNSNNQIIFRDNNMMAVEGKNVILLLATTTTGLTIRRAVECIHYYGGTLQGISSIFSTVKEVDGMEVESVFTEEDVPGYTAYARTECPYCQKGMRIEAMVNGFGYSRL
ncbi:MAG: orotate phosphoribosyltransferase [Clostridiales bacterium]|nr:orotate phosphoribosyltransferase [Clostridiales bacterium]MCD8323585.1 orotate phosphoribosyltransferase [Clostridiales bacterium]